MTPTPKKKPELTPQQKKWLAEAYDKHKGPFVKVFIERIPGSARQFGWQEDAFNVRLAETDELIVSLSRDPECDACRVLKERGIIGTLETWRHGEPVASARWGIEKYAKLAAKTGHDSKPRFVKFRKFEAHLKERFTSGRDSAASDTEA